MSNEALVMFPECTTGIFIVISHLCVYITRDNEVKIKELILDLILLEEVEKAPKCLSMSEVNADTNRIDKKTELPS